MFFNANIHLNKDNIDEDDVVDCVKKIIERMNELERENEMLREQIIDLRLGVA